MADSFPVLSLDTAQAWEAWLGEHHDGAPGVWLKLAKKGTGITSLMRGEAVEGALCYGWIDGQSKSVDATYWLQRFTPRRSKSIWSKVNREKALGLIAAGRMQPAGFREVERAQADGRWDAAYDPPSGSAVPEDLQVELDLNPAAATFFAGLDSRNRYAILHRIQIARKPETRVSRIRKFVTMLDEGRTLYP